ncbi:MAG TPA: hypothetical protein DDX68_01090 [Clostridium sp.]|nr:hypothetical protein [Clostridium sp.]
MFLSSGADDVLLDLWYTRVGYYKQGTSIMIILAAYEGEAATQLSPELASSGTVVIRLWGMEISAE